MAVTVTEIPERLHDSLVDRFGESQSRRYRGYFFSQSLREILEILPEDSIIEIQGRRKVLDGDHVVASTKCASLTMKKEYELDVCYHRDQHGPFVPEEIIGLMDSEDCIGDVAVNRLVFRFTHKNLHNHLLNVLEDTLGFSLESHYRQPFFAVMESQDPGNDHVKTLVKNYHDEHYYSKLGYGWKTRTLDLVELWSADAYRDVKGVVASDSVRNYTLREIEDLCINRVSEEDNLCGAVNSMLVINRWRNVFGAGSTDTKSWQWKENEGWVREI